MWTFILWISAAVYQAEGKAGNVPFSPFFSVTLVWIITREGGGGTPIHTIYRYVPPNVVVILKLMIQKAVSISEAFSRTGCNI